MGVIAIVQSFVRVVRNEAKISDVQVDPGGGANITAEHFSAPGDDSHPMPGDYVAISKVGGTGRTVATGYLDPLNDPVAAVGEKRSYSRDGDGAIVAEVWLKADGEITILNANGQITLKPDGSVLIGVANEAQVLGDKLQGFADKVLTEVIGICTAPTTMGSVLAVSQKAALTALQTALSNNVGDGQIRSNKHKTGLT